MLARRALAPLAVGLVALVGAAPALARSADVIDADVALLLAKNGELLVTETLTFDYDGHFQGSYRDIPLKHGEAITDVRVSENGRPYEPGACTVLGCFDFPGRFGTEVYLGAQRIVWHYRATDEERTYEISYRVHDGAVAHDDVIDIAWTVWGDQWEFDLDHLTASFTDATLDPANDAYRVWGHPRTVEGETVRGEGQATLEASDVDSGTAVELRVTLPRTPERDVTGMRIEAGDGLPEIVAFEQGLDEDHNAPYQRFKRWLAHNSILAAFGLAGLAALLIALLSLLAREHRRGDVPEYLPEPPDDAGPALAYGLAREGGDSTDTVLATLLDLVERGYYSTKETQTEKEKLDIAIKIADDRPLTANLERYEAETLEFFDALVGKKQMPLSEMADSLPKHSALWRGRWERMTEKLDAAEEQHLSWDRDLRWLRLPILLGLIAGYWYLIAVHLDLEDSFPWIATTIGVVALIGVAMYPGRRLRRIGIEHSERAARWAAFARWTEEFPKLEDDPPATLELWKRILVYGVAFGTAERMIASGRIPEPVLAASGAAGGWSSAVLHGNFSSSSFDGSSFGSGFASQVAPPASSSSGGGGSFSGGGGGGFSGGGGGGSW